MKKNRILRLGLLFLLLLVNYDVFANKLLAIDLINVKNEVVGIRFNFTDKVITPKFFVTKDKLKLVFDFPKELGLDLSSDNLPILPDGIIEKIIINKKNKIKNRILFNLSKADNIRILRSSAKQLDFGFKTAFLSTEQMPTLNKQDKLGQTETQVKKTVTKKLPEVRNIKLKKGASGDAIFTVDLPQRHGLIKYKTEGDNIILSIQKVHINNDWVHKMNVSSFETPLVSITGKNSFADATFILTGKSPLSYKENIDGNTLKIIIRNKKKIAHKFDHNKKITLNLQDISIRAVLQILANFSSTNMVVNDDVGGSVTLRLNEVPWQQALEIILVSEGLGKRLVGDIIYIAPSQEIVAHEKAELEAKTATEAIAPLIDVYLRLNYSDVEDISKVINTSSGGMLSPRGSMAKDKRTNTLVIQDTAEIIKNIKKLVSELDVPTEQVLIEARIVEISRTSLEEIGVNYGLSNLPANIGSSVQSTLSGGVNSNYVTSTESGASNIGIAFTRLFGGIDLSLEIRALETVGDAKIVSSPHLIVSDNQEAYISQGKEIPYLEATSSGAASIAFKEAVLELRVTPQIAPNDYLVLDIKVKKDQKTEEFVSGDVPILDKREIETRLLVKNKETIVLGGIYEKDTSYNESKVPLLGDIPLLGWLFKSTKNEITNKELLIFITPTILKIKFD